MCICKTSLPHRPDDYIGFTSSCPPHILQQNCAHGNKSCKSLGSRPKRSMKPCYTNRIPCIPPRVRTCLFLSWDNMRPFPTQQDFCTVGQKRFIKIAEKLVFEVSVLFDFNSALFNLFRQRIPNQQRFSWTVHLVYMK